jgi:hypothetical protein
MSEPAISAPTKKILMTNPQQIVRPRDSENAAAERTTKWEHHEKARFRRPARALDFSMAPRWQ